jgi:hypothetical protein
VALFAILYRNVIMQGTRQTLVVTFETRLSFYCRVGKEKTSVWLCPKVQDSLMTLFLGKSEGNNSKC